MVTPSHALLLTLLVAAISGCNTLGFSTTAPTAVALPSSDNPKQIADVANQIIEAISERAPEWVRSGPILVATLVDVNQLEQSSTLGRLLSEQLSARLVTRGYRVTEIKLRSSLYVKKESGELMLAREVGEIAAEQAARAVLVGTYAAGKRAVHLNVKLIDPATGTILAAEDALLTMDNHLRSLLR